MDTLRKSFFSRSNLTVWILIVIVLIIVLAKYVGGGSENWRVCPSHVGGNGRSRRDQSNLAWHQGPRARAHRCFLAARPPPVHCDMLFFLSLGLLTVELAFHHLSSGVFAGERYRAAGHRSIAGYDHGWRSSIFSSFRSGTGLLTHIPLTRMTGPGPNDFLFPQYRQSRSPSMRIGSPIIWITCLLRSRRPLRLVRPIRSPLASRQISDDASGLLSLIIIVVLAGRALSTLQVIKVILPINALLRIITSRCVQNAATVSINQASPRVVCVAPKKCNARR